MTKREKHEVACVVRAIMNDECNEIRKPYVLLNGNLKGLRKYVRKEVIAFFTDYEPYLDGPDMGREWLCVDGQYIDLDECWCMIRDGLEFDLKHEAKRVYDKYADIIG